MTDAPVARGSSGRGDRKRRAPYRVDVELRCRQCGYEQVVRGRPIACPNCRGGAWEPVRTDDRSGVESSRAAPEGAPCWQAVEDLLTRLVASGRTFPSATTSNRIASYERGRRLMLETDNGSRWVDVGDVRACWETFERMRRIRRADVLEPGRCSAFMMALFAQVPGIVETTDGEMYLTLSDSAA